MSDRCVIRIDATRSPGVHPGNSVRKGQNLLIEKETEASYICPVSGIVEEVHFDPERHEFVISIATSGS